jgi:RNA polymerase subunit RPABC4/transcription elongation factor Spt4
LEDTIVRFGDLWGEVNVRPNDEDDDAYIFAELSTPLHHNDRIRTLTRSGAILSFSDMSTFVMKEDTTIVLDIATEHKSKIMMVAGNVWTNFKRMWIDGTMEIEMNQGVLGTKGTTFICEEINGVSTLKVLEGEVEFTSKATGEAVLVSDGQMISADAYGLGEIEPFDIEEEMKGWHETARQITANEINKKSRRGVFITIGLVLALGIIASVIIVVLRHERSRKLSPVPTIAPYYVPKHCSRCGNSVPPASKYCPFCSAPRVAPYTAPRHCSRCGKTLPPGGKFCPICGAPVPVPLRIHTGRF